MKATIRIATGPAFEYLEVEGDEAHIPELLQLQRQYSSSPIRRGDRERRTDWFGQEYWYSEARHEYSNEAGDIYDSSSQIAERSVPPFDQARIAAAMAKKPEAKLTAEGYIALWTMKADISKGLGTALHAAIEMRGRYGVVHDNPMLREVVQGYFAAHTHEMHYEVVVVDHQAKRASRIDILEETPDGFVIRDIKTDVNVEKNLPKHQVQLNVSRQILLAHGIEVAGMYIDHYGTQWTTYKLERQDV